VIPDDPQKALRFVAAFLPGFVGIGLASYLVDLRFGEFWYAFISIALSAASFKLVSLAFYLARQQPQGPSSDDYKLPQTLMTYAVALVLGCFIAIAYDRDWAYDFVNYLPFGHVSKTSEQRPLLYVISHTQTCASSRLLDGREDLTQVLIQTLVRATIKDYGVVEGLVRVRPTDLDPDQVFLSPACKIQGDTATAIPGPGVLIRSDNVAAWELVDATSSMCWKVHYGKTLPCVCPSGDHAEKYLARINKDRPTEEGKRYEMCKGGR